MEFSDDKIILDIYYLNCTFLFIFYFFMTISELTEGLV